MGYIEVILIAISLAMDAFAVSICKGLSVPKVQLKHVLACGVWFGLFQAIMPIIGYFIGVPAQVFISKFACWIAFALLLIVGINMIVEAIKSRNPAEELNPDFGFKSMIVLAIATSIDALAVGFSFSCTHTQIFVPAIIIGVITMALAMLGVKLGNVFGCRFRFQAELIGGIILILLGIKIVLESYGFFQLI